MRLARGAMPGGQKTMEGRIEIAPIENPRHRRITYSKRKAGLVRKATELAVLCDADVAVLMCNADQESDQRHLTRPHTRSRPCLAAGEDC